MTFNCKRFIESNIILLDTDPDTFWYKAAKELASPDAESLVKVFTESGVDMPDRAFFLAKNSIFENIKYIPGISAECGQWATWLNMASELGDYKLYARAALELPEYYVYEHPCGYEGTHDYLIIHKKMPLSQWIKSQNWEIYDQTGDANVLSYEDFKSVIQID